MQLFRKSSKELPMMFFTGGQLTIYGRCIPVEKSDISHVINQYINNYARNPQPLTEISIDLDYINCQTQRQLLASLQRLSNLQQETGTKVKITWYYDSYDDSMLELGDIFRSMVDVEFEFVEKKSFPNP